jgi:hypothetical protein
MRARWLGCLGILCCSFACSATCLRDSDCIGESLCVQDRCLLLVRADAAPAPRVPAGEAGTGGRGAAAPAPGTGGGTTAPRDILDASSDAALSAGDL